MWILELDLSVSELKNFVLYFKLSPAKQWDHNLRQSSSFRFRAGVGLEVVKWAHRGLGHNHAVPLAFVVMFLFPLGSGCWFLGVASANFSFDFRDSPHLALCGLPSRHAGSMGNLGRFLGS